MGITILVIDDEAGPIGAIEDAGWHPGDRLKYEVDTIQANWRDRAATTFWPFAPNANLYIPETIEVGQVYRDWLQTPWKVIGKDGLFGVKLATGLRFMDVPRFRMQNGEYMYDPKLSDA